MLSCIYPEPDNFFKTWQPHQLRELVADKQLSEDAEAFIEATGQDNIFNTSMPPNSKKRLVRKTIDNIVMRVYDTRN